MPGANANEGLKNDEDSKMDSFQEEMVKDNYRKLQKLRTKDVAVALPSGQRFSRSHCRVRAGKACRMPLTFCIDPSSSKGGSSEVSPSTKLLPSSTKHQEARSRGCLSGFNEDLYKLFQTAGVSRLCRWEGSWFCN